MRRSTANNEQGVTLIEIMIALVLVGVLAALGLPQLSALFSRNKVQTGLDLMQGALQDVQKQAIRQSRPCTLQLAGSSTNNSLTTYVRVSTDRPGCLAASSSQVDSSGSQIVKLPDEVRMATNIDGTTPEITFSFKGHASGLDFSTPANYATIVIFPYNQSSNTVYPGEQKCLIISSLLGIVTTGTYSPNNLDRQVGGSSFDDVDATDCSPSIDGMQR